jgi:hypothetical protein
MVLIGLAALPVEGEAVGSLVSDTECCQFAIPDELTLNVLKLVLVLDGLK